MSTITIAETMEVVTPVKKLLKTCVGDSTEAELIIDIPLGDSVIAGRLNEVYGDKLLVISFSKNHYKYLLDAYIKYLLVTAQGLVMEVNYLSAATNSIFTIPQNTLTKTRALEQLTQLVSLFKKGHAELFLLYPGLKDNPLKMAGDDMESINKKINDFFKTNSDEYLKKELNNGLFASPDSIKQFIENTIGLFSPVAALFPELIPLPKNAAPKD